ncbi:MAG: hypothetical protein WCI71_11500, partial [Bacteroidota bacterium]
MKKIIIILILNLMTLVIVNLVVAQQKSPISPSTLTKRMFGWHHMDFPDVVSNYHWESISDLSWLGYLVDPLTGNPKDQNNAEKVANWSIDPAVLAAKNHNVRINLCVGFEPSSGIPTFISNPNPSARSNLREKIIAAVVAANADGVNINFENEAIFTTDDNLQRFHSFIEEVENGIGPNRELSITLIPSWCTLSNFTTFINLLNDNIDL